MYRYLIVFLLCLSGELCFAHHAASKPVSPAALVRFDSTGVVPRKFNPHSIAAYAKEQEFRYKEEAAVNLSFWERLWRAVWKVLELLLKNNYTGTAFTYVIIAVLTGAVLFLIIKFSGLELSIFTGRSKPAEIPYTTNTENIHEINFSRDIAAAVNMANYRLAVRLHYLSALKRLSDKQMIDWRPEKTNHTYIKEVSNPGHRNAFAVLTSRFEYIWYGEFYLGREKFESLAADFDRFNRDIT